MQPGPWDGRTPFNEPAPRKSKTPWIIGTVAAVAVVVVVAAASVLMFIGADESQEQLYDAATAVNETPADTSAPVEASGPPDSVTYEINGTSPTPVTINYGDSDGDSVQIGIRPSDLPWSLTITPAPDLARIWALPSGIVEADLSAVIKQGDTVLESCVGAGPCIAEPTK